MSQTDPVRALVEARPWGEVLRAAWNTEAREVAPGIFCSDGTSNAYAVRVDGGRVIVNTGLGFEAYTHKALFDVACPGPTSHIFITQGHVDHLGGVSLFREPGTLFVTQANNPGCQADDARIAKRRQAQSYTWFADVIDRALVVATEHPDAVVQDAPVPDRMFADQLELTIGGRRFVLISTPGGETVDSCVIHLPDESIAFTGNLFGPLFPHFPNFNTIRGDKYRFADAYLASLATVRALDVETLITGHGDPIRGRALIRACLDRLEAAVRYVHDATLAGINDGEDVHTLAARIRLPDALYVGEGYGRVAWAVRTFWESYLGWFRMQSTSELYPRVAVGGALAELAGPAKVLERGRAELTRDPNLALALAEAALELTPGDRDALRLSLEAHRALLARPADAKNFWLGGWLRHRVRTIEETLAEAPREAVAAGEVRALVEGIPGRFVKSAAKGLSAVYQYDITGPEAGTYCVVVEHETCRIVVGPHPSPDCRIVIADQDFLALNYGELHPLKAAMQGKIKFEGDRAKAIPLERIFEKTSRPKKAGAAKREIFVDDLNSPKLSPAQAGLKRLTSRTSVSITADGVLAAARHRTGLSDFGAMDFLPRLELLVADYAADVGMSAIGRATVRKDLVRHASNRLLLVDYLKQHPEALEERIERPLIVAGLPRSGTTHLVNLLAADSRFRSLPLWEAMEPLPNPREGDGRRWAGLARAVDRAMPARARDWLGVDALQADPRYLRCAANWAGMRAMVPYVAAMHPMNPDHVHEELELMASDFASYLFEWTGYVPRYRDHYLATDQRPHYAYLRTVLKVLQHRDGGARKPWVLKCPQHLEQLPALMDTFPDATVVFTHRDPVAVIQSTVTMLGYAQRMGRDQLDMPGLLAYWADRVEHLLTRGVQHRGLVPAARGYDLLFHEFMADTEGKLDAIYALHGLPRTETSRAEQAEFLRRHPRGRDGQVRYDLRGQFGTDPAVLRARYGFYFERFGVRPE